MAKSMPVTQSNDEKFLYGYIKFKENRKLKLLLNRIVSISGDVGQTGTTDNFVDITLWHSKKGLTPL